MKRYLFQKTWIQSIFILFSLTIILSIEGVSVASAEAGSEEWVLTFARGWGDAAYFAQQTRDGGYVIATDIGGERRPRLIRVDASGNLLWENTYGNSWGSATCVKQTYDDGYILTGYLYNNNNPDIYLVKLDKNGIKQWDKSFGGNLYDYGAAVQQTTDGGYIIAGTIDSNNGDYTNAKTYLVKTDNIGNKQWEKTFTESKAASYAQETNDGGYIVAGGNCFIKIDNYGEKQWAYNVESTKRETSVKLTNDSGYIITLKDSSSSWVWDGGQSKIYLRKLDPRGNQEWEKQFNYDYDSRPGVIQQTSDGGYIIAGYNGKQSFETPSTGGWTYFYYIQYSYLLKTDTLGNKQWEFNFGGKVNAEDYISSIQQTADGGYILAGKSGDNGYLIKLRDSGPTSQIQFDSINYTTSQNEEKAIINATRSGNTDTVVSVTYGTSNKTAIAGIDYISTTGTLIFNPGETIKSFAIPIIKNSSAGSSKSLVLCLSLNAPFNGVTLGTKSVASLTLTAVGALTGQITMDGLAVSNGGVAIDVFDAGGNKVVTGNSGGNGSFSIDNVPVGTYTLKFKAAKYLVKKLTGLIVTSGLITDAGTVNLRVGDVNGDNAANLTDLVLLAKSYSKSRDNMAYNTNCDFNGDNTVNLTDLVLLAKSYGLLGDN